MVFKPNDMFNHSNAPHLFSVVSGNETDEERLLRHLFKNYQSRRLILPVTDRTKPIQIHFDAHLLGLAKVVSAN